MGQSWVNLRRQDSVLQQKVAAINADEIKAPAIIEFKNPIYGKSALAVNITNLKKLMKLVDDNENYAIGKEIELKVISVRHPNTNEIVPSLAITQVR